MISTVQGNGYPYCISQEIASKDLNKGLRGVAVGTTMTSFVDPDKGVHYRDISVKELVDYTPEEVVYYLYYGQLPTSHELDEFRSELCIKGEIPEYVREGILHLPQDLTPMKLLSIAVTLCSTRKTGDYRLDGLDLLAKMPGLVEVVMKHYKNIGEGKTEENSSDQEAEAGLVERFVESLDFLNLKGESSEKNLIVEAVKLYYILHFDHGGGNLSTFIGKGVASSLQDQYGAFTASLLALEGTRHGGAVKDSVKFMIEMHASIGENPSEEEVKTYVQGKLKGKEKIPGFGHAVLQCEDPRATLFYEFAEKHEMKHPMVQTALKLRKVVPDLLKQHTATRNPYPNVDAISGTILWAAGFPFPEFYPLLFALSRVVGITRQVIYERDELNGGKGGPIYRPHYQYIKA